MKKALSLKNIVKLIKAGCIAGAILPASVYAYVDYVWYPDNGAAAFTYDMGQKKVTDPDMNVPGQVPVLRSGFVISGTYYASCKSGCTTATNNNHTFFTAKVPGLQQVAVKDGLTFYKVTENLAVAIEIKTRISSSTFVNKPLPYEDVDNGQSTASTVHKAFNTGTEGTISLMILKPFIGESIIPPTIVASLWGTLNPAYHDESAVLSQVSLKGSVLATQTCDFTSGKVIKVDFGKIMLPEIAAKGPVNGRNKLINLDIKCTNISSGVAVKMRLNGEQDANDPNYLKTTNPDVGIRITEHDSNTPISPAGGVFPASGSIITDYSDYTSQTGNIKLDAVPVNTTGNKPGQGAFSATSTITIELQ
ncbi:fimbrial protein [Atlantibacter hermannii]|uniref:fimbrial protein n=1 Tax=Atlantibacter hermannii TaxID=565 RepID=UPI002801E1AB|nr:fimbrial protein [Atlantibacter hermannii]MDQ7880817.1 fimbrial protein [Atlantibacter hermannii]